MANYFQGVRTSNVTISNAALEIIAGISGCRVMGIYITVASAAASVFGVGRPAVAGITPTTPTQFPPVGASGARSLASVALAWATSPTNPAVFYRRCSLPTTIGAVRDFVFRDGIWLPPSTTLVLQNITGNGLADVDIDISE